MAFKFAAHVDDLRDDEPFGIEINGEPIALYRISGEVFATHNICTHQYALLSEGYLDGDCIECPLHQACFDVRTGAVVSGSAETSLKIYPVRIEDDDILVDV
ncbi:MAG: non-heme iron oxygenase ferredoxin subunit [Methylovirgula sp.]|uniref:non-heme iron oxygenase ferredoxin subunit n=1 Tax=Methylovirgula sp. TaxID=1978224 RepID=UPI00307603F0